MSFWGNTLRKNYVPFVAQTEADNLDVQADLQSERQNVVRLSLTGSSWRLLASPKPFAELLRQSVQRGLLRRSAYNFQR